MTETSEPRHKLLQPSSELQAKPTREDTHHPSAEKNVRNESIPGRRTKVTTACLPCRTRKVKCDGQRPVCSRLGGDRFFLSPTSVTVACPVSCPSGFPTSGQVAPEYGQEVWHGNSAEDKSSQAQQNESPDPAYYGEVGRTIQQELVRRGRRAALGTASVGPLATNIHNSVVEDSGSDERPTNPFQTVALSRHNKIIFQPSQQPSEIDYELPRRAKSDALFGIYWELFHPVFPTLDVMETKAAYARLWTSDSAAPNRIFLSIINMIFALASRVDSSIDPAKREDASARYCGRALDLFNQGRMYSVTFPSIQAALLIAEYLHSLQPEQCWMYSGIAIRTAQSLGLHRPGMISFISSSRALLLCRRVWKLCVVWDRILCMTYGRSMMVSQREAALCSPLHAISTDLRTTQETWAEERVSLFLDKTLDLYMVVGPALDDFSSWDLEGADHESHTPAVRMAPRCIAIDRVLRYDRGLSDFHESLPATLSIPAVFEIATEPLQQRHAVILRQRFLQARVVLLRPMLTYLVRLRRHQPKELGSVNHQPPDSLADKVIIQCAISCVYAAHESIHTVNIYKQYRATHGSSHEQNLTNTWWHNVLYLYSAATVLIAARFCNEVVAAIGKVDMENSWTLVLQLFQQYEENDYWVRQLSQMLQRLVRTAEVALSPTETSLAAAGAVGEHAGRVQDGAAESRGPGAMESLFVSGSDGEIRLAGPFPDPLAVIEGGMPFFQHGEDLDAVYYFGGNDPFSGLGDGVFGG